MLFHGTVPPHQRVRGHFAPFKNDHPGKLPENMNSTSAPGAFSSSRGESPTLPLPPAQPILPRTGAPTPPPPVHVAPRLPTPHAGRYSQGDRAVGQRLGRQDLSELQVATNHLHLRRAAGRRFAGALGTPVVLAARGQRGAAAAQHRQQQQHGGHDPRRAAAAARRAAESAAARGQHGGAVQDPAPLLPATDGPAGRGRREGGKKGAPVRPGLAPRGRCRSHSVPRERRAGGSRGGRGRLCVARVGPSAEATAPPPAGAGPRGTERACRAAAPLRKRCGGGRTPAHARRRAGAVAGGAESGEPLWRPCPRGQSLCGLGCCGAL